MNVLNLSLLEDDDGDLMFTASVNGDPMPIGELAPYFRFIVGMRTVTVTFTVDPHAEEEYQPPV